MEKESPTDIRQSLERERERNFTSGRGGGGGIIIRIGVVERIA